MSGMTVARGVFGMYIEAVFKMYGSLMYFLDLASTGTVPNLRKL